MWNNRKYELVCFELKASEERLRILKLGCAWRSSTTHTTRSRTKPRSQTENRWTKFVAKLQFSKHKSILNSNYDFSCLKYSLLQIFQKIRKTFMFSARTAEIVCVLCFKLTVDLYSCCELFQPSMKKSRRTTSRAKAKSQPNYLNLAGRRLPDEIELAVGRYLCIDDLGNWMMCSHATEQTVRKFISTRIERAVVTSIFKLPRERRVWAGAVIQLLAGARAGIAAFV